MDKNQILYRLFFLEQAMQTSPSHTAICVCIYIYIMYVCICMYVCMFVYVCVYVYNACVFVCVCVCVCMCAYEPRVCVLSGVVNFDITAVIPLNRERKGSRSGCVCSLRMLNKKIY